MYKNQYYELFRDFLLDADEPRTSEESAKSYVSYLRGANRRFFPSNDKNADYFAYVADLPNETRIQLMGELISELQAERRNPASLHNKKTLGNYCSALRALEDFYQSPDLPQIPLLEVSPAPKESSIHIDYSMKDVRKSFRSRLKTQDRFYAFGSFPCRLLGRVFGRDKDYFSLFENLIDKTKILLGSGSSCRLQSVHGISIENGYAYALVGKDKKLIYTEAFKNGHSDGFKPMEAFALSSLSLDHDWPLSQALEERLNQMPTLKRLGEDIIRYRNNKKFPNAAAFTKDYYANAYGALAIDKNELLGELKDFFSHLSLTLMSFRDNSSKNNGGMKP